jgi:hypothetical protein
MAVCWLSVRTRSPLRSSLPGDPTREWNGADAAARWHSRALFLPQISVMVSVGLTPDKVAAMNLRRFSPSLTR